MSLVFKDVEELLDAKMSVDLFGNLIGSLRGLSLNSEFCDELVSEYPSVIVKILCHAVDVKEVSDPALDFLINVSSHPGTISKVLNSKPYEFSEFAGLIVRLVLKSPDFNIKYKATQLLSNVTRENVSFFEQWKTSSLDTLDRIFKVALLSSDIEEEEKLKDDSLMIVLNLSQEITCQRFIMENLNYFNEVLTISETASEKWNMACFGLIKNLLKNSIFHDDLVKKTDLLAILLRPLVGLNDYEEKIIKDFPDKLKKYLGISKDISSDLRKIILESLYLLCATKSGRIDMRSFNVYDILKNISELDLADEESDNCLDCIGLLIRTEDEIGFDDLLTLQIPNDIQEKFNK